MMLMLHCIRQKSVASKLVNLRFSIVRKFCYHSNFERHTEILRNLLGCSSEEGTEIISKNVFIQKLEPDILERSIAMLHRFSVANEDILENPNVMLIRPATIEHHSMLLQEGGFEKMTAGLLIGYLSIIRKRISLLKAHGLIREDTNVVQSFLSHLDPPPAKVSPYPHKTNEDLNPLAFRGVYEDVMMHYLSWRLNISRSEVDRLVKKYVRIRHRSLRLLRRALGLLEEELGFSKDKILRNGYLIYSHPDNVEDILRRVPSLAGMDIKEALDKYPKMVMGTCESLLKTNQYLKEFGISDEAIQRCMHIFTLGSESVKQRLENLREIPEFRPLTSHPRVLRLVHYQQKALTRLDYLQEQRVRCASLHLLSGTRAFFEKYAQTGEDRNRGSDVIRHVAETLDQCRSVVRVRMHRHHLWNTVPLIIISDTLDMLLARGFSKTDIWDNVHLLIYPRERVEKELDALPTREEVSTAKELQRSRTGDEPAITPSMQLALCIYYLEKNHHFSGDGIWSSQGDAETDTASFNVSINIPRDGSTFRARCQDRPAKVASR